MGDCLGFEQKIERFCAGNALLEQGDRVLVCLSGGADSVCLLRVLLSLKERLSLTLYAAHVNHMLRGADADADEAFCRSLCAAHGVELFILRADVKKIARDSAQGFEAAARQVRYDYFSELKERYALNKIATAHNKNDNAETSLMYFLRGSGIDGLKGIRVKRADGVVRPLLCAARAEIEAYLQQLGQEYRTDATNLSEDYTRNRIRSRLLPQLAAEYNPNVIETLADNALLLALDAQYLNERAAELEARLVTEQKDGGYTVDVEGYCAAECALRLRVLRRTVARMGIAPPYAAVMRCDALFHGNMQGKAVSITDALYAQREYGAVRIYRAQDAAEGFFCPLLIGEKQYVKEADTWFFSRLLTKEQFAAEVDFGQKNCAYFDYNSMSGQIYIRSRKNGDTFAPFGMEGKKKLKEYLIDEKVSAHLRGRVPLIDCGGEILWVCGHRRSALHPVSEGTKTILKIVFWEGQ